MRFLVPLERHLRALKFITYNFSPPSNKEGSSMITDLVEHLCLDSRPYEARIRYVLNVDCRQRRSS